MTTIIGDMVIADPVTLVITSPAVLDLIVQSSPVVLAAAPAPVQMLVLDGQGATGPQGVPGPAGPRGLPGASSVPTELDITATGGAQVIVLPSNLVGVSGLFINGLRQGLSNYTLLGTNLTLPPDTVAGDAVSILFFTP